MEDGFGQASPAELKAVSDMFADIMSNASDRKQRDADDLDNMLFGGDAVDAFASPPVREGIDASKLGSDNNFIAQSLQLPSSRQLSVGKNPASGSRPRSPLQHRNQEASKGQDRLSGALPPVDMEIDFEEGVDDDAVDVFQQHQSPLFEQLASPAFGLGRDRSRPARGSSAAAHRDPLGMGNGDDDSIPVDAHMLQSLNASDRSLLVEHLERSGQLREATREDIMLLESGGNLDLSLPRSDGPKDGNAKVERAVDIQTDEMKGGLSSPSGGVDLNAVQSPPASADRRAASLHTLHGNDMQSRLPSIVEGQGNNVIQHIAGLVAPPAAGAGEVAVAQNKALIGPGLNSDGCAASPIQDLRAAAGPRPVVSLGGDRFPELPPLSEIAEKRRKLVEELFPGRRSSLDHRENSDGNDDDKKAAGLRARTSSSILMFPRLSNDNLLPADAIAGEDAGARKVSRRTDSLIEIQEPEFPDLDLGFDAPDLVEGLPDSDKAKDKDEKPPQAQDAARGRVASDDIQDLRGGANSIDRPNLMSRSSGFAAASGNNIPAEAGSPPVSRRLRLSPIAVSILSNKRLSPAEKRSFLAGLETPQNSQELRHSLQHKRTWSGAGSVRRDAKDDRNSDSHMTFSQGLEEDPNCLHAAFGSQSSQGGLSQGVTPGGMDVSGGGLSLGAGPLALPFGDVPSSQNLRGARSPSEDAVDLDLAGRDNLAAYELNYRTRSRRQLAQNVLSQHDRADPNHLLQGLQMADNDHLLSKKDTEFVSSAPKYQMSLTPGGGIDVGLQPGQRELQPLDPQLISSSRADRRGQNLVPSGAVSDAMEKPTPDIDALSQNGLLRENIHAGGYLDMGQASSAPSFPELGTLPSPRFGDVGSGTPSLRNSGVTTPGLQADENEKDVLMGAGARPLSVSGMADASFLQDGPQLDNSFVLGGNGPLALVPVASAAKRVSVSRFQSVRKFGTPSNQWATRGPVTGAKPDESLILNSGGGPKGVDADPFQPDTAARPNAQGVRRNRSRKSRAELAQEKALRKKSAHLVLTDAHLDKQKASRHDFTRFMLRQPEIELELTLDLAMAPTIMPATHAFAPLTRDVRRQNTLLRNRRRLFALDHDADFISAQRPTFSHFWAHIQNGASAKTVVRDSSDQAGASKKQQTKDPHLDRSVDVNGSAGMDVDFDADIDMSNLPHHNSLGGDHEPQDRDALGGASGHGGDGFVGKMLSPSKAEGFSGFEKLIAPDLSQLPTPQLASHDGDPPSRRLGPDVDAERSTEDEGTGGQFEETRADVTFVCDFSPSDRGGGAGMPVTPASEGVDEQPGASENFNFLTEGIELAPGGDELQDAEAIEREIEQMHREEDKIRLCSPVVAGGAVGAGTNSLEKAHGEKSSYLRNRRQNLFSARLFRPQFGSSSKRLFTPQEPREDQADADLASAARGRRSRVQGEHGGGDHLGKKLEQSYAASPVFSDDRIRSSAGHRKRARSESEEDQRSSLRHVDNRPQVPAPTPVHVHLGARRGARRDTPMMTPDQGSLCDVMFYIPSPDSASMKTPVGVVDNKLTPVGKVLALQPVGENGRLSKRARNLSANQDDEMQHFQVGDDFHVQDQADQEQCRVSLPACIGGHRSKLGDVGMDDMSYNNESPHLQSVDSKGTLASIPSIKLDAGPQIQHNNALRTFIGSGSRNQLLLGDFLDTLSDEDDVGLAFYELLELRTEAEVDVSQSAPFEPIHITSRMSALRI
ncbi:unnamed protein product [Amoebophrya sp. A25]|nr:unnamed protein product [Amoebophrya sp. A25]|eukprot:GSA25T00011480001.1